ncbi:MAG: hypothetical protein H8D97_01245 [Proteobacteria bacterium]|nr:hypothetical protein [Pseudomonadota bacterium]
MFIIKNMIDKLNEIFWSMNLTHNLRYLLQVDDELYYSKVFRFISTDELTPDKKS